MYDRLFKYGLLYYIFYSTVPKVLMPYIMMNREVTDNNSCIFLLLPEPTNHTLGLTAALELIRGSGLGAGEGVLLVYVSRGVVGSRRHARKVLLSLANALTDTSHKVVISTLALGLNNRELSCDCAFC